MGPAGRVRSQPEAKESSVMAKGVSNARAAKLAADQKLIAGVQSNLSQLASLTVGSQNLAPAAIVQLLQSRVSASQAVLPAQASYEAAVKAERDVRAKTTSFVTSLRRVVTGMFSESPDTLATFGLRAPKAPKTTVTVKAEAVAKSRATRAAKNGKPQPTTAEVVTQSQNVQNAQNATGTTTQVAPAAKSS
jgi:hypothetical protein